MHGAGADRGLQFGAGPLGDHLAPVDHRDAVGERVGLLQILRGEEHRGAVGGQQPDDVPDLVAAPRVEAGGRLVEEEEVRRDDQAGGDVEPPPHAAGIGLDLPARRLGEAEAAEQVLGAALASRRERPSSRASSLRFSAPVRSSSTEANWPVRLIRPAQRVGVAHHVEAEHVRRPGVGPEQRREDADHRRLAGAVRPEQAEDRAPPHGKVDAVDGPVVAEHLGQAGRLDGEVRC